CGHMVIMVDGAACTCGRKGCWEAYASATALIRQTKEAMEKYPDSVMHELAEAEGKVSGRTAFDAMRKGDIPGIEVVNNYIKYVACGLINLVNALQPEIICIGGGICNEGDTLMTPLKRFVQAERYSIHSKIQTKIMKAELGNDAGVIGAALLGSVQ
ncbi:MAG: ROK family protein, partial [Eubacterium sp.]|nr:ROK family protein [Eubacterium sp.]